MKLFRINLIASFITGWIALWGISLHHSEDQNALLGGYSISRLAVFISILFTLAIISLFFFKSFQTDFWNRKAGRILKDGLLKYGIYLSAIFLSLSYLALCASSQLLREWNIYRERLYPVFIWIMISSIQLFVTIIALKANRFKLLESSKSRLLFSMFFFALLLIVVWGIAFTKIGLKPDVIYWQGAGAPILFWQVIVSLATGWVVFCLFNLKSLKLRDIDILICIAIWCIAFAAWSLYPAKPSYNALPPKAPNFEMYPFGDSIVYDITAQGYLIGIPIPDDFWVKPVYSFFLAVLHGIAGQNYNFLTVLQVGIFALIPVTVFILTAVLSNRIAGVTAAFLIVFRELNALSLSNVIQITHSKLFMTDMFVMGLVVAIILLQVLWLRDSQKRFVLPFIVGGALGILFLTRSHTILLLPFTILAFLFVLIPKHRFRQLFMGVFLLCIGFAISLSTWVWRNYQWTGNLGLQDDHSTYTAQFARLYSQTPLDDPVRFPGEDDVAYLERIKKQPLNFILRNPGEVVHFISAHYMHNMIFSFVYLPHSVRVERAAEYVMRMPFWKDWLGEFSTEARLFLFGNLLILGFGLVSCYQKSKEIMWVPFILGIGYNLSVSLGRISGWRFILPADWITIVFYAAGLVELSAIARTILLGRNVLLSPQVQGNPEIKPMPSSRKWWAVVGAAIAFLIFGLGLTQGHHLAPVTYPPKSTEEILAEYRITIPEQQQQISADQLRQFLEQDKAVALYGRGLYPLSLSADTGELNYFYLAFAPRPYKRLVFQLIGPREVGVVLPVRSLPKVFPNAADVYVFGCYVDNEYISSLSGYVDALAVVVNTDPPIQYVRNSIEDFQCATQFK